MGSKSLSNVEVNVQMIFLRYACLEYARTHRKARRNNRQFEMRLLVYRESNMGWISNIICNGI